MVWLEESGGVKEARTLIDVKAGEEMVEVEEKWKAPEEGWYKSIVMEGLKKKVVRLV